MKTEVTYRPTIEAIEKAALNLKEVALKTPLVKNDQYSQKYPTFDLAMAKGIGFQVLQNHLLAPLWVQ